MGLLKKSALVFVANGVGLYLANLFVPNVSVALALEAFAVTAATLTLINLFLGPLLRLVLTPIIILTLGLGSVLVNALTLYLLDLLLPTITIGGLVALFLAALIVSAANLVIHFFAKII